MNRRVFLKEAMGAAAACLMCQGANASNEGKESPDGIGMLVDTTECIGCRKCEWACNRENSLTDTPLEAYEDKDVFEQPRRMSQDAFTVVNRYQNPKNPERPVFIKLQCMHCVRPACVSACLGGALSQEENGAVVYDASKCMGCRYCMVACPFQVPSYEYNRALTPRVRKCIFCFERLSAAGSAGEPKLPACAEMCPPQALTFGTRSKLLELAHEKINADPNRYVPHVYGENEVGGTAWLYLASKPFEELGLLTLGDEAPPDLTETIQHSIFRYGLPPLLAFPLLVSVMRTFSETDDDEEHHQHCSAAGRKE